MTRLLERTADLFALIGGAVVIFIVLVTTLNAGALILDRIAGLFGTDVSALPGYEELVRLAISVAALMFFPYCQLRRGHVAVDLFVARLPQRVKTLLDRIWLLLTAAVALFLAWWMVQGLFEKRADGVITGVLGLPEWPFYAPGIVALILWAVIALVQLPGARDHA